MSGLEKTFRASLCMTKYYQDEDYLAMVKCLHPQERIFYGNFKFTKRQSSYLLGRLTAKRAIAALTGEAVLDRILIEQGFFNQPVVSRPEQNIQVSITHCGNLGGALAFPEVCPMGIDIETIDYSKVKVLETQITSGENEILASLGQTYVRGLTIIWTAKEALSKVLKTGLLTPLYIFEMDTIFVDKQGEVIGYFKNFPQYQAKFFYGKTYVCAIVYPKKTELNFISGNSQQRFLILDD